MDSKLSEFLNIIKRNEQEAQAMYSLVKSLLPAKSNTFCHFDDFLRVSREMILSSIANILLKLFFILRSYLKINQFSTENRPYQNISIVYPNMTTDALEMIHFERYRFNIECFQVNHKSNEKC